MSGRAARLSSLREDEVLLLFQRVVAGTSGERVRRHRMAGVWVACADARRLCEWCSQVVHPVWEELSARDDLDRLLSMSKRAFATTCDRVLCDQRRALAAKLGFTHHPDRHVGQKTFLPGLSPAARALLGLLIFGIIAGDGHHVDGSGWIHVSDSHLGRQLEALTSPKTRRRRGGPAGAHPSPSTPLRLLRLWACSELSGRPGVGLVVAARAELEEGLRRLREERPEPYGNLTAAAMANGSVSPPPLDPQVWERSLDDPEDDVAYARRLLLVLDCAGTTDMAAVEEGIELLATKGHRLEVLDGPDGDAARQRILAFLTEAA